MAKTRARRARPALPGPQAPSGTWSPDVLLGALRSGSLDDKVAALRAAEIIDAKGKITKKYKNWGSKITRTPEG
jgi:hypothetical protein